MNKTLAPSLTLIVSIVYFLSACGGDKQPTTNTEKPPTPIATPETEKIKPEDTQAEIKAEPVPTPESRATDTQSSTADPKPTQSKPAIETTTSQTSATPQQEEMLALAKKSGCMACHAVDKKIVGPAWKDVAKRYTGNAGARKQLIEKVSKGGKGNWTNVVGTATMPPYHPRVTKENIAKLVDFVLSLPN